MLVVTTRLLSLLNSLFFFTHTPPTEIYTLSLHDALPIFSKDSEAITAPLPFWARLEELHLTFRGEFISIETIRSEISGVATAYCYPSLQYCAAHYCNDG